MLAPGPPKRTSPDTELVLCNDRLGLTRKIAEPWKDVGIVTLREARMDLGGGVQGSSYLIGLDRRRVVLAVVRYDSGVDAELYHVVGPCLDISHGDRLADVDRVSSSSVPEAFRRIQPDAAWVAVEEVEEDEEDEDVVVCVRPPDR